MTSPELTARAGLGSNGRRGYLHEALRLYLQAPDTPERASRNDWTVAGDLYAHGVPLPTLAHAIRLASLRRRLRHGPPLAPITTLAYFRRVFDQLTPEELDPGYVDYVHHRYRELLAAAPAHHQTPALSDRQNPALSDRR